MSEVDCLTRKELDALNIQVRSFERVDYGCDGRITSIVDFYDGWCEGLKTTTPAVPRAVVDKKQWLIGWDQGQRDKRARGKI